MQLCRPANYIDFNEFRRCFCECPAIFRVYFLRKNFRTQKPNTTRKQNHLRRANATPSKRHNVSEQATNMSASSRHNVSEQATNTSASSRHNVSEQATIMSASSRHNVSEQATNTTSRCQRARDNYVNKLATQCQRASNGHAMAMGLSQGHGPPWLARAAAALACLLKMV